MKKTEQDIINDMISDLTSEERQVELDSSVGSVARDIVDTSSNKISERYEAVEDLRPLRSISYPTLQSANAMSQFSLNYGAVQTVEELASDGNEGYVTKIEEVTSGLTLGTKTGFQSLIQDQFSNVAGVEVVAPTDDEMSRNQFGGSVDVYIFGELPTNFSETFSSTNETKYKLDKRPVLSLSSVVGATNGTTYSQGVDYQLSRDTSVIFGFSTRAFDYIEWLASGNSPQFPQTFRVLGQYDKQVEDVQNYLDHDDRKFPASDILVKRASRIGIVINASALAFAGRNRTDLQSIVEASVIDSLTNYTMGDNVEQSDLVRLIGNIDGIDRVTIPFTDLRKSEEDSGTVHDSISIDKTSYVRIDSIDVDVT